MKVIGLNREEDFTRCETCYTTLPPYHLESKRTHFRDLKDLLQNVISNKTYIPDLHLTCF